MKLEKTWKVRCNGWKFAQRLLDQERSCQFYTCHGQKLQARSKHVTQAASPSSAGFLFFRLLGFAPLRSHLRFLRFYLLHRTQD